MSEPTPVSTGNFLVNQASVLTTSIDFSLQSSITISEGARTIDIYNNGHGDIFITGNQSQGTLTLGQVSIPTGTTYSFVNIGKPYPAITVSGEGLGSYAEIIATY